MNAHTITAHTPRRPVIADELDAIEPRVVGYVVHVEGRRMPPCYRARIFHEYDAALAVAELVSASSSSAPTCSVVLAVAHGGLLVLADVATDGNVELVVVDGEPVVVGELGGAPFTVE